SSEHEVAEHLRTRREYCRALLDLSRRQRAFIAESNYSELMSVIGRKQRVLGRLDALKQQDPALVANWKSRRAELSAAARNRCEELLHETESILANLIAEEKTCTDELTRRRDETSRQLAETSSGRRAHRAYGTPQPDEHRYLDVNQ
ncbi:MAG: flagellar export chaperone FlgN, partial [Planctomycetaceae bacterium]